MTQQTKTRNGLLVAILALTLTACGGGSSSTTPTSSTQNTGNTGNIGSVNHAPSISGSPRSAITAGASYTFTPTATDSDGDNLSYSIANKPAWASFNTANGTIAGTPSVSDAGTTSNIVITVSDGSETAQLAAFDITVSTGSASLKWTAPAARADGTTLSPSDIGGYRVYRGTTASNLEVVATIADSNVTEYSIASLTAGNHYFAVTTYDQYGSESEFSNIGSKMIN